MRSRINANVPAQYNPDWFGVGLAADAVRLEVEPLKLSFYVAIPATPDVTRRAGEAGDEKIRTQIAKMERARAI